MRDVLTQAYNLRRDELQEDVEIGWLSPELFGEAEAELDRGLLEDVEGAGEFSFGFCAAGRANRGAARPRCGRGERWSHAGIQRIDAFCDIRWGTGRYRAG